MTLEFTGFVFSIFYQPTTPTLPGSSIIPRFGTLKMHQNAPKYTKITKFNILTSPEWSECRSTDFCMTLQASGFVFYKFRYPYTPYPPYILEFLCCRVSFCFKITDSDILGPPRWLECRPGDFYMVLWVIGFVFLSFGTLALHNLYIFLNSP